MTAPRTDEASWSKTRLRLVCRWNSFAVGIEAEGDLADALRAEPVESTDGQFHPALRACARCSPSLLFLLLTTKANRAEYNRKNAEGTAWQSPKPGLVGRDSVEPSNPLRAWSQGSTESCPTEEKSSRRGNIPTDCTTRFFPDFAGKKRLRNRQAANTFCPLRPTCWFLFIASGAEDLRETELGGVVVIADGLSEYDARPHPGPTAVELRAGRANRPGEPCAGAASVPLIPGSPGRFALP